MFVFMICQSLKPFSGGLLSISVDQSGRITDMLREAHHYLPKSHKIPWVYDHNRRQKTVRAKGYTLCEFAT